MTCQLLFFSLKLYIFVSIVTIELNAMNPKQLLPHLLIVCFLLPRLCPGQSPAPPDTSVHKKRVGSFSTQGYYSSSRPVDSGYIYFTRGEGDVAVKDYKGSIVDFTKAL